MTKRSLTGLLALLLVAVVGGVAWLLREVAPLEETSGVRAIGSGDEAAARGGPDGADLVGLPAQAGPEEDARAEAVDEASAPVEGVSAGRFGWWRVPKGSIWVHGRVELPQGTPLDEEIWVTAEGSSFVEKREGRRTHSSKAKADGTFTVAFSSRTKRKGKITIRGKYLYLKEPHWVSVTDEEELAETVLEPLLGGRVIARVLPPRAVALSGDDLFQGVEVLATRGGSFLSTKLSEGWVLEEGEYELGGVPEGSDVDVVAKSPVWADGRTEDVEVTAGATTIVDVPLTLGASVAGVVLDHEGNPVDDAQVMVMTQERAGQRNPFMNFDPEDETVTSNGRFELSGIIPGELVLIVDADGFLEKQVELGELTDSAERTNLTVRLDRGRLIAGYVKWPGGELADGAVVRLAQEDSFGNMDLERVKGEIELGPDGRFEFSALEEGSCNVTASAIHPDDRPDPNSKLSRMRAKRIPHWMARAEKVAPGTMNLSLTLSPGDVVSGKVVNDIGEPVEAFKVTASPEGSGMFSASSMKPVRGRFKSDEGEFHLKAVQPGQWEVWVSATGFGDSERKKVTLPGAGDLHFMVPRTGNLDGIVRAPSGEPARDARVIVTHGGSKTAAVTTEKDGTFAVGKVEPGWVEVVADADGFGRSEAMKFEFAAAGKRKGIALQLEPGAVLTVEVHEAAGTRAGRTVTLATEGAALQPMGPGRNQRTTDSDGRAVFDGLDPGTYEVTLEPDGGIQFGGDRDEWLLRFANQKSVEVTVTAGEQLDIVVGGPSATAITVSGSVTRNGEPVAGALVMVLPMENSNGRPDAAVRADEAGRYEVSVDEPGQWRFQIGGDFGSRVTFIEDVPAGEKELVLDFEIPEAKIEGTLTGPGGELLSGRRISLVAAEADGVDRQGSWFGQRYAASDENGHFEFENLGPGQYNLRAGGSESFGFAADDAEYGYVIVDVEVKDDAHVALVDVKLKPAARITGRVSAPDGSPAKDARVRVTDEAGRQLSQWTNVRSNADGSFTYDGVGPGTYLVSAIGEFEGETLRAEERKVKVYEGGAGEVFLTLD